METHPQEDPVNAVITPAPAPPMPRHCSAVSGCTRYFLGQRFVYVVVSARAHGLCVGVNMNPDADCNFDCAYCEIDRSTGPREAAIDCDVLAAELDATLELVLSGAVRRLSPYATLPTELARLRHVALSGDGEPTLCPNFLAVVETVIHVRARRGSPFFPIVLVTNSSHLDAPCVRQAIRRFTPGDSVWAKLDAGTQEYFESVNRADVPLEKILDNILLVARERPVVIQSLFPAIHGLGPPQAEIDQYALRLKELHEAGAQIALVQIYSAARPPSRAGISHLPLRSLSAIAQTVRRVSGLPAEVF